MAPAWSREQFALTARTGSTLSMETDIMAARAEQGGGRGGQRTWELLSAFRERLPDTLEYRGQKDLSHSGFSGGLFESRTLPPSGWCDLRPQCGRDVVGCLRWRRRQTLHFSDLMGNKGLIWASDRAEWRLKRLELRDGQGAGF